MKYSRPMKALHALIVVSSLLLFSVAMNGCAAKNTYTNLPAGVTSAQVNAWVTANNGLTTASSLTDTAVKAVIAANRAGVFPDGTGYANTLRALGQASQIEIQAANFLQTVPNNFGQSIAAQLAAFTTQIGTQLSSASGLAAAGIKNATTQQQVVSIIAQITSAIAQIQALVKTITSYEPLRGGADYADNVIGPEDFFGSVHVYA